jgi:hypothetical protein
MRTALVTALILLLPEMLSAQPGPGIVPTVGAAIGVMRLPEPTMETCGGNPRTVPAVEVRVGVGRCAWSVEVRGTASDAIVVASCETAAVLHESGAHTDRVHPFDRGHGDRSVSAYVQYAPERGFWRLGLGTGRLFRTRAPFLLASGALRTHGRVGAIVEVQSRWTRLRSDLVTAEWSDFAREHELSRERDDEWHGDFAILLGVELRFH